VESSVGVVTALTPELGYQLSAKLAHEALHSNRSIRDLVLEQGLMTEEELNRALSPKRLSGVLDETTAIVLPEVSNAD